MPLEFKNLPLELPACFLEVTGLYARRNSGTGMRTSEGLMYTTSSTADRLGDSGDFNILHHRPSN